MTPRPLLLLLLAAALLTPLTMSVRGETRLAEPDPKLLQGRWERPLTKEEDGRGGAKAVKEIAGNRETVSYLDDTGEPVYVTTADFKVEQSGRVTLYTYTNFKVVKGKEKDLGAAPKGPVSYIYRVEGDLYYEAHGLLVESPKDSRPTVVVWKRKK